MSSSRVLISAADSKARRSRGLAVRLRISAASWSARGLGWATISVWANAGAAPAMTTAMASAAGRRKRIRFMRLSAYTIPSLNAE
ncbi:MAG: hypothetical protein V4574_03335 [Pseudomonadota bacterium]